MTETQAKAVVQQLVTLIDTRIELAVANPDNSRHYLHLENRGQLEADILADLLMSGTAEAYTDLEEARSPEASGLCCMRDHANAVPPWTCDCPCHRRE